MPLQVTSDLDLERSHSVDSQPSSSLSLNLDYVRFTRRLGIRKLNDMQVRCCSHLVAGLPYLLHRHVYQLSNDLMVDFDRIIGFMVRIYMYVQRISDHLNVPN